MNIEDFRQTLRFDNTDLIMNRQGLLSDNQKKHFTDVIQQYSNSQMITTIAIGIIVFVIFAVDFLRFDTINQSTVMLVTVIMCFTLSILYIMAIFKRNLEKSLSNNNIEALQGVVKKRIKLKSRSLRPEYFLTIGGITFQVSKKSYQVFNEGDVYTIHYSPILNKILSVENSITKVSSD